MRRSIARSVALAILVATALFALGASQAGASPGSLKILILNSYTGSPNSFNNIKSQLAAEPEVATVDSYDATIVSDGGTGQVPTAAQLSQYDAVVVLSNYGWSNMTVIGDLLADFVDHGGVVVADIWSALDTSGNPSNGLAGRWLSGGYSPFLQTVSGITSQPALGAHDASNPIFAGVGDLTARYAYPNVVLDPGASLLASWADGRPAFAVKGRVLITNNWLGDHAFNTGNYGRLAVNAIKNLGYRIVTIRTPSSGKGTVTSSAGPLSCTATECTGLFLAGSKMTLSEKAAKGSAFAGWTQVCPHTAKTCDITVGYPSANPFAWNTTPIGAQFASTRGRIIGFTKNKVNLKLPSAGRVILKAPGTLKVTKYFKRFDHNDIAIKLKRSLRAKIGKSEVHAHLLPDGRNRERARGEDAYRD
jgi:hypothetical protein